MIYFSIHKIVGVIVEDNYPWLSTLLNDLPHIFICSENECSKCRKKIIIKYERQKNIKKKGKDFIVGDKEFTDYEYGVKISFSDDVIVLNCTQECNEWMMFAIAYQLNSLGFCFIHAAAFEKDGNAVLIPSAGGTGKTIISLELVSNKGFRLLGDDLCIIDKNGNAYSYPKKMVIYPWHWEQLNKNEIKAMKKPTFGVISKKVKEPIKKIIRHFPFLLAFLRKHNLTLKQYSPEEVFKREVVTDKGRIYNILFLERQSCLFEQTPVQIAAKVFMTTYYELFHYFSAKLEFLCREKSIIDPTLLYVTPYRIIEDVCNKNMAKIINVPAGDSSQVLINTISGV